MVKTKTTFHAILGILLLTLLFLSSILLPPLGEAAGSYDVSGLFFPWLAFARDAVFNGRLPLWDASLFAGYPFLSNPQVAFFYPPTWLAIILPVRFGISAYLVFHIWISGVGMYLFARQMNGRPLGSFLAAVTFAFSGYAAARVGVGHIGLLATNSWLPWLLLATVWGARVGDWRSAIAAALPWGLAILAGHTASLLYIGIVWTLFALYLIIGEHLKWTLVIRQIAVMGVMGLALSAVQLLPLLQFIAVSTRASSGNFDFAAAYSFPPAHLITLLVPQFFGEPTHSGYWSVPTFEELTYYVGILPIFALLLALRRPTRLSWFYLGVVALAILLALGSYGFLFEIAYYVLPPFRLTRAPARAMFMFVFGMAALLGHVVSQWEGMADRKTAVSSLMRYLLPIAGISLLTALAATGAVFASVHPTDTSGRLWVQIGGWGIALIVTLVGGGLLWAYLITDSSRITLRHGLGVALIALVVADLWLFGFKLIHLESTHPAALWTDAKAIIGEADGRVLPWGIPIFEQNGAAQVGLNSVFGYNAMEIGTHIALTTSVPDPRSTAYDLLDVVYVVASSPQSQFEEGERPLTFIGSTDYVWVYQRARPLGLARLVGAVEVIPDESAAIARLHQPDFNVVNNAILSEIPPCELSDTKPVGLGTARLIEQRDGYWRIETDTPAPSLLILSETAYPGWEVTIDGKEADVLTAYTALKAVCIPAGTHIVEWTYKPTLYIIGGLISLVALTAVMLCLFKSWRVQLVEPFLGIYLCR